MKHSHAFFSVSLTLLFTASVLVGCGKNQSTDTQPVDSCPFSKLDWDSTVDDMTSEEGSDYTTSDSIYGGTAYTYSKSCYDTDGSVKYMFDENNNLMSIAWSCSSDTSKELENLYDQIQNDLTDTYGESGYNLENKTTLGDVWYPEGGDIVLSAVTTDAQMLLQYSYLNPQVSNTDPDE